MAVTVFPLLLAALSALAGPAILTLPAEAADDPRAPVAAWRTTEVPADELSDMPSPAETPPPDFTAAQYIDSAGCVFVRTERGWRARVARDRAPVCGYPPTFSARRTGPDSDPALFRGPAELPAARIQRELAEAIIPGLQSGELVEGTRASQGEGVMSSTAPTGSGPGSPARLPGLADAAVNPAEDTLHLGELMVRAPELSRQVTGAGHIERVCALIGSPQASGAGALGLCGAAFASPAARAPATPSAREVAGTARAAVSTTERGADRIWPRQGNGRAAGKAAARPRPNWAAEPRRDDPRMVPPGARYVQIGAFRDLRRAERAAGDLAAMGLPVVRSRAAEGQARLIMVGPLDGREAVIRMIDRLRRAGYPDVVARR